ncbi:MAG: hypothetical protein K1X88_13720 [Nannocystaceae bacterium]|nr:hypothetical protein [Nannocystaceae bacterium]
MMTTPSSRRSLAAALLLTSVSLATACGPKAARPTAIASPDGHRPQPAASGSGDATEPARDVASVCAEASPIAALAPRRGHATTTAAQGPSDAAVAVLGYAEARYTMADLQALAKRKQHLELLQHIEDVAPASRTAAWHQLLERTAIAVLESLSTQTDGYRAFEAMGTAEALLQRYADLAQSKAFMAARGRAGTAMFGRCFELSWSGEECVSLARDFIAVEGTDAATKLAIAKLVRQNQYSQFAVPFFRAAVRDAEATACGDEDLALAVTAGLAMPPDAPEAQGARDVAQNACFAQLQPTLVEALIRDDSGYFRDNTCAVLRAKGAVR